MFPVGLRHQETAAHCRTTLHLHHFPISGLRYFSICCSTKAWYSALMRLPPILNPFVVGNSILRLFLSILDVGDDDGLGWPWSVKDPKVPLVKRLGMIAGQTPGTQGTQGISPGPH